MLKVFSFPLSKSLQIARFGHGLLENKCFEKAGNSLRRFSVCSILQDDKVDKGSLDKLLEARITRNKTDKYRLNRGEDYFIGNGVRRNIGYGDSWNDFLGDIPKEKQEFTELEKNFYLEHEAVRDMTEEEVKIFHERHNVKVYGDVPNPVLDLDHVNFPEEIKTTLTKNGISTPSAIQSLTWPIALSGLDSVGIAQTGSGKTLGFMLPAIVHTLNQKTTKQKFPRRPRVLILAPTRELTQQIASVSFPYCKPFKLRTGCLYGGSSKSRQMQEILGGLDIIVATPGRLLDILREQSMLLEDVSYLVLDEADRMLDMGFEPQIRSVMKYLSPFRQTTMWSATWPVEVKNLAQDFMSNNVQVRLGHYDLTINKNINQKLILVDDENDKLYKFVDEMKPILSEPNSKVLIFTNTKAKADNLAFKLHKALKKKIVAIHGDIGQFSRDRALKDFRLGMVPILVATDVAARGIDVTDITHVVNFDFPRDLTDYVHRVGRTGRAGRKGDSISFLCLLEQPNIVNKLVNILKESGQDIPEELMEAAQASRYSRNYESNRRYGSRPGGSQYGDGRYGGGRYGDSKYGGRGQSSSRYRDRNDNSRYQRDNRWANYNE